MADNNGKSNGTSTDIFEHLGIERSDSPEPPAPLTIDDVIKKGERSSVKLGLPAYPTGRDPLGKYDSGLLPGQSQAAYRAKSQSVFNKGLKAIANMPFNIGLSLADMAGITGELASYGLNEISGEDYDVDFNNALIEFAEQNKDPLGKSYRHNPGAVTDFRDPAFYLNTITDLIESVSSFLIAGGGIGAGALKTTSYIANTIGKGLKAGRLARGIQKTSQFAGQGFTSASLGYFEGAMSGKETFREVYNAELRKTGDPVASRKEASRIAADVANTSAAAVTALSLSSFYPIFQSTRLLNRAGTFGLTRKAGESSRKFASRMAKAKANPNAPAKGLYEKFGVPIEAGEEALQEVANLWATERGRQKAGISEYDSEGLELFADVFMSEEGLLSAALGGIGGTLQTVGMMRIPFHKRNIAKEGEEPQFQRKSAKDLAELQRANAGVPYAKALEQDIRDVITYQNDLENAIEEGNPAEIKLARERLYSVSAKRSIPVDGGEALKASLAEMQAVDNQQNLYEVYASELEKAEAEGNTEMVEGLTAEIQRLQETFPEQNVVTEAMSLGLADSPTDNEYQETIEKKLAEVDEIKELYEGTIAKYNYGDEAALGLAEYVFDLEMRKRVGNEEIAYLNDAIREIETDINKVSDSILPEDVASDDFTRTALNVLKDKKEAIKANIEEFKKQKNRAKSGSPQLRREYGAQTDSELQSILDNMISNAENDMDRLNEKVLQNLSQLMGESAHTYQSREDYKSVLKAKDRASRILRSINDKLSTIDTTKGRQNFVDTAFDLYKEEEKDIKAVNEKVEKEKARAKEKDDIEAAKETKNTETSDTPGERITFDSGKGANTPPPNPDGSGVETSPSKVTKGDKKDVEGLTSNDKEPTTRPENPTKTSGDLLTMMKKAVDLKDQELGFGKKTVNSNKINWGSIREYGLFTNDRGSIHKETTSATRVKDNDNFNREPRLESYENSLVGEEVTISVDREYDDLVRDKQNNYVQPDFDSVENAPMKIEYDGKIIGYLPSMDWLTQQDQNGNYINIAQFQLEDGTTNAEFEIDRLMDIRKSIFEGPKTTTITDQSTGTPIYNYVEVKNKPARRISKKASTALPDPSIEFGVVSRGMITFPSIQKGTNAAEGTVMALLAGVEMPMWIDPISKNQAELIERAILATHLDSEEAIADRAAINKATKNLELGFDFNTDEGLARVVGSMVYTSNFDFDSMAESSNQERVFFHVDDRSSAVYIGKAEDGIIYTTNRKLSNPEKDNGYKPLFVTGNQLAPAVTGYLTELTSSIDKKSLNSSERYETIELKTDGTFGVEAYDTYNEYAKTRLSTYIDGTNTINHGTAENPNIEYLYFEQRVTLFDSTPLQKNPKKKPKKYVEDPIDPKVKEKWADANRQADEERKGKTAGGTDGSTDSVPSADSLKQQIAQKEQERDSLLRRINEEGVTEQVNTVQREIDALVEQLKDVYQEEADTTSLSVGDVIVDDSDTELTIDEDWKANQPPPAGTEERPPTPSNFVKRVPGKDPEVIISRTKDTGRRLADSGIKERKPNQEELESLEAKLRPILWGYAVSWRQHHVYEPEAEGETPAQEEIDRDDIRSIMQEDLDDDLTMFLYEDEMAMSIEEYEWTNKKEILEHVFSTLNEDALEEAGILEPGYDDLKTLLDDAFDNSLSEEDLEYAIAQKKAVEKLLPELAYYVSPTEIEQGMIPVPKNQADLFGDASSAPSATGERFETESGNVTITEDGTMLYDNGNEVTTDKVKNKVLVKKEAKDGTLRYATYNGTEYAILSDDRIISQGKTTSGKEVYTEGPQRQQILESIGKTEDNIRPSQLEQEGKLTSKPSPERIQELQEILDNRLINRAVDSGDYSVFIEEGTSKTRPATKEDFADPDVELVFEGKVITKEGILKREFTNRYKGNLDSYIGFDNLTDLFNEFYSPDVGIVEFKETIEIQKENLEGILPELETYARELDFTPKQKKDIKEQSKAESITILEDYEGHSGAVSGVKLTYEGVELGYAMVDPDMSIRWITIYPAFEGMGLATKLINEIRKAIPDREASISLINNPKIFSIVEKLGGEKVSDTRATLPAWNEESEETAEVSEDRYRYTGAEAGVSGDNYTIGEITLNDEQTSVVDEVLSYVNDKKKGGEAWFNLRGKAGTGKTTIAQVVAREFLKENPGKQVYVSAFTNKATKVIEDKFVQSNVPHTASTVASLLGLREDADGNFVPQFGVDAGIQNAHLLIIDESSMINEEMLEMILGAAPQKTRIVFMGDEGQLPPIRQGKYFKGKDHLEGRDSPVFENTQSTAALYTRVRQGEESPILPYADYYWENSRSDNPVKNPAPRVPGVKGQKGTMVFSESLRNIQETIFEAFRYAVQQEDPNYMKVVTFRNASRQRTNSAIHNAIFGVDSDKWMKGDMLMFNSGYGIPSETGVYNSTEGIVTEVEPAAMITEDHYAFDDEIEAYWITFKDSFGETFRVPALTEKGWETHAKRVQQLWDKAKSKKGTRGYGPAVGEAVSYKNHYPKVDYGYAITSHKSQGSTYDNVVVDGNDILSVRPTSNKDKSQSIYTALTRARNVAIMIDRGSIATPDVDIKALNEAVESNKQGKIVQDTEEATDDYVEPTYENEEDIDDIIGEDTASDGSDSIIEYNEMADLEDSGVAEFLDRHTIDGYDEQQVSDVVGIITHIVARQILQNPDVSVDDSLTKAYKAFKSQRAKHERNGNLEMEGRFRDIINKWDRFQDRALRSLKSIGYEIVEGAFEGEQSDYERRRYNDRATWQQSNKDTASSNLKLFMSHLPQERFVERDGEKITIKTNSKWLGLPRYVPLDETFDKLLATLVNKGASIDNYLHILEDTGRNFAPFKTLAKKLRNLPDTSTIKDELIKAMSNQYLDLVLALFEPTKDGDGNIVGMTFKPIHSDRNSAIDMIYNDWVENLKDSDLATTVEGQLIVDEDKVTALKQEFLEEIKSAETFSEKVPAIRGFLESIGIDLHENTWENILNPNSQVFGKGFTIDSQFRVKEDKPWPNTFMSTLFKYFKGGEFGTSTPLTSGDMTKVFRFIASIEYKNAPKLYASSFLDVNGNSINPYQMHSLLSDSVLKLATDDNFIEELKQFTFNSKSWWARTDNRNEVSIEYLDGVRNQLSRRGNDAVSSGRSDVDLLSAILYFGTVSQTDGKKARMQTTAKSDKTLYPIINAPRVPISPSFNDDNQLIGLLGHGRREIKNLINAEFGRILHRQANEKAYERSDTDLGAYGEGSKHFVMFPELNAEFAESYVDQGVITREEFNKVWGSGEAHYQLSDTDTISSVDIMYKIVEYNLMQQKEALLDDWRKSGLVGVRETEVTTGTTSTIQRNVSTLIDKSYLRHHTSGARGTEASLEVAAADFLVNHMVSMANEFMVVSGDPASFWKGKPGNTLMQNIIATRENINKRLARDIAPRSKGDYDSPWITMAAIADPEVFSKEVKEIAESFGKMEIADAQEYTTVMEHLRNMKADGQLSLREFQELSGKVKPGQYYEFTQDEMAKIFTPLKPVYTGHRSLTSHDVRLPVYVKSSSFPLLPQVLKTFQLDKLRKEMETGNGGKGIDRVSYVTANKVGVTNVAEVFEGRDLKDNISLDDAVFQVPREGFGLQQDVPVKDKNVINVVSQANKLIFNTIRDVEGFNFEGAEYTGRELEVIKEGIRASLLKQAESEMYDKLGISTTTSGDLRIDSLEKIKDLLKEEGEKLGWNVSTIDGIELSDNGQSFRLPIPLTSNAGAIESLILAQVSNIALKQEMKGYSYVQGSSAGIQTLGDYEATGSPSFVPTAEFEGQLNYMRRGKEQTQFADIMVPWNFRDNNGKLLDINDFKDPSGKVIDSNKLPEDVRRMIGLRIPNQGHNSMIPLRIVGFLPPNNNLAIVPEEIVGQMGSDYDVDKLYTYQPQTTYNKVDGFRRYTQNLEDFTVSEEEVEGVEEKHKTLYGKDGLIGATSYAPYLHIPKRVLQDKYFEIFESVLSHPEMFDKIRSPLDKKDMFTEKDEINSLRGRNEQLTSPVNYRQQRDYTLNQKGAQTFVGIFALANTFNAIIEDGQRTNLKLMQPGKEESVPLSIKVKIGGKTVSLSTLSGEGSSTYNGEARTTADNISIVLSEAVDNTNNNNLGALNFKLPIASSIVSMLMVKSADGQALDLGYITKFINQPIIDNIINRIEGYESTLSENYTDDIYSAIQEERKALYSLKEKDGFKKKTLGESDLKKTVGISLENMTEAELDVQLTVLSMLNDFARVGDDIRSLQSFVLSPATNGLDNRVIHVIRKEMEMKEFFKEGASYIDNIDGLMTNVNGDPSEQSVAMDVIYNNGKRLINRLMPEYGKYLYPAIEDLSALTGVRYSNKQMETIWKGIKAYMNSRVDLMNVSEDISLLRERLLFGTEDQSDLATRVQNAKDTWGRDHYFLNRLQITKSTRPGVEPSKIEFRADKSVRIDDFMNTITLSGLLRNADPVKRKLGKDLVLYDLINGGVQGPVQYSKYIPPTYLEYLGIDNVYNNFDEIPLKAVGEILQHNPGLAANIPESIILNKELSSSGEYNNDDRKAVDYLFLERPEAESDLTKPKTKDSPIEYHTMLSYYNAGTNKLELYKHSSTEDGHVIFRRVERKGILHVSEYGSDRSLLRMREQFPPVPATTQPISENPNAAKDYSKTHIPSSVWGYFEGLNEKHGFMGFTSKTNSKLEGMTAYDVLSHASIRDNISKDALPIYDLLVENIKGKDISVFLTRSTNTGFKAQVATRVDDATGEFLEQSLTIATQKVSNPELLTETMVHELLHLSTKEALKGDSPAAKALRTLHKKLRRELGTETKMKEIALGSVDEMVSWGMVNTKFQKLLNETKFDGKKSALDRLKEILVQVINEIKNRLGFEVQSDSALNELINRTVELITDTPSSAKPGPPTTKYPPVDTEGDNVPRDENGRPLRKTSLEIRKMADFENADEMPEGITIGEYMESGAGDPNAATPKDKAINVIQNRIKGVLENLNKTQVGDPKRETLQGVLEDLQNEIKLLLTEDLQNSILKVAKSQAGWVNRLSKDTANDFSLLNIARRTANNWNWETTQKFLTESEKDAKEGEPGYEVKEAFIEAEKIMELAKYNINRTLSAKFVENINDGLPKDYRVNLDDLSSMKDIGITGAFLFDLSQTDNQLAAYMFDKMTRVHKAAENEFQSIVKEINTHLQNIDKSEWEDFRQLDSEGNWTGEFISEYSAKYTKHASSLRSTLRKELREAYSAGTEESKNKISKALSKYHENMNKIQETIDIRMLIGDGVTTRLWDSKEEYREHLINQFGEDKAEQLINEAIAGYEQYKKRRKEQRLFFESQHANGVTAEPAESWIEAQMKEWESLYDPMRYMDEKFGIIEGGISEYTARDAEEFVVAVPRKKDSKGNDLGYYDQNFENLNENQREFYQFYIQLINRLRHNLPTDIQRKMDDNFFPKVKRRFIEEISENGLQAALGMANENLTKSITAGTVKELNEKHGAYGREIDPETGLPVKEIQVLFTDTDVHPGDLSFDIAGNLKQFANSAINYKWKSQIEDEMLIGLNIIKQADKVELSGKSPLLDKYRNLIVNKEGVPRLSEATEYNVDSLIYNRKRQDMGESDITIYESWNLLLNSKKRRRMKEIENERDDLQDLLDANKISQDEYDVELEKLEQEYRGDVPAKIEGNEKYISQLEALEKRKDSMPDAEYARKKKEIQSNLVTLKGRNLVWSKLGDRFLELTQIKGMGWNFTAGIANVGFGMISNTTWAANGQDFNGRELAKAYGIILNSLLPGDQHKKVQKLVKLYNVLFEVTETEHGKDKESDLRTNGKVYTFFAEKMHPYFIQSKTEYTVQGASLVAQMLHKKLTVLNKETGKEEEINLFEAYDNNAEWNSKYEQPDSWRPPHEAGMDINNSFSDFKNKVIQVNKYLHGNYDPGSPWLIKKTTLGRMVGQFRSWIPYGFKQRFAGLITGKPHYDRILGREFKGRYTTYFDVGAIKSLRALVGTQVGAYDFAYGKKGSKDRLSELDIQNIKMNLREIQVWLGLLVSQLGLKMMLDDLEEGSAESRAIHLLVNQMYRVEQDIYFYLHPETFLEILRNPVPVLQTYTDAQRVMTDTIKFLTDAEFKPQEWASSVGSASPFANQFLKTDYLSTHLH